MGPQPHVPPCALGWSRERHVLCSIVLPSVEMPTCALVGAHLNSGNARCVGVAGWLSGGSSDNFQVSRQIRSKSLSRSHGVKTHRRVRASRAQLQSHRKRPLAPATGAPWACLAAPNKQSSQVTSEGRCCYCQRRAPPPQRGCDRRAILSLWRRMFSVERTSPRGFCPQGPRHRPGRSHLQLPLQALALEPPRPPRPQDRPRCAGGGQAARAECHGPLRQGSGGGGVVSSSAPSVSTVRLAVLPQGGAALPRGRVGRGRAAPSPEGPPGRPAGLRLRSGRCPRGAGQSLSRVPCSLQEDAAQLPGPELPAPERGVRHIQAPGPGHV